MTDSDSSESPADGDDESTDSETPRTCPECGSTDLDEDPDTGEVVCRTCGLVVEPPGVDRGPEWRAYTAEEREEKTRVGAPTTQRLHDKGLTTEIDWRDTNAYGSKLTPERRRQMQRIREWHRRYRARGQERSLRYALGEIDRMASSLDVPVRTRESAAVLFRRALDADLLPGRSIEGIAASCLYAACRRDGVPRSLDDVSSVARVDRNRIARNYRQLKRELGLEIAPTDPREFVPQIASALDLSDAVERRALEIISETAEQDLTSGKSPKGYAAAAVYLAARLCDERVSQATVAETADVAEITIRKRYQEQAEALGIEF